MKRYFVSLGLYVFLCLAALYFIEDDLLLAVIAFGGLGFLLLSFEVFLLRDALKKFKDELFVSEKTISLLMESLSQKTLNDISQTAEKILEQETNPLFREKYQKIMKQASLEWFRKIKD